MTRIKICGLREVEHAVAAAAAGADYLGMVFKPSRRQVTPEQALDMVQAVKTLRLKPETVGVFADLPAIEVNGMAARCGLDRIQLGGDETCEYCREIVAPVIKVIHITPGKTVAEVISDIEKVYELSGKQRLIILLDTQVGQTRGGTGQTFDWRLAAEVSRRYPVMVAGGLTPENVGRLVREVKPWGVDVSSGVEENGIKSVAKIKDFIQAVRSAGG